MLLSIHDIPRRIGVGGKTGNDEEDFLFKHYFDKFTTAGTYPCLIPDLEHEFNRDRAYRRQLVYGKG